MHIASFYASSAYTQQQHIILAHSKVMINSLKSTLNDKEL